MQFMLKGMEGGGHVPPSIRRYTCGQYITLDQVGSHEFQISLHTVLSCVFFYSSQLLDQL